MMRWALMAIAFLVFLAAIGWWFTAPTPIAAVPNHTPNLKNGERLYHLAGCASCHTAKNGPELAGGDAIESPVGDFYAPNITPHPTAGIGKWSDLDFVNAVQHGISPDGAHYFPSFPYASYRLAKTQDILDIKAYIFASIAPVDAPSKAHTVPFPFNVRRGIGVWKEFAKTAKLRTDPGQSPEVNRGAYIVQALGHCGECHTPRTLWMTMDQSQWLEGAPGPSGGRFADNLTPHAKALGGLSDDELQELLTTGEASFGIYEVRGKMLDVVDHLAKVETLELNNSDTMTEPQSVKSIIAYLRTLKPVEPPEQPAQ